MLFLVQLNVKRSTRTKLFVLINSHGYNLPVFVNSLLEWGLDAKSGTIRRQE